MRILWFTNTSSKAAVNLFNKEITHGGWISSLEDLLINEKEIVLGVCFNVHSKIITDYKESNSKVKYFPIPLKTSKIRKSILKYFTIHFEEKTQDYLKVIADFKPDLIHIFGTEGPYGLINKYTDIPIIYNIQGNLNSIYLHQFKKFSLLTLITPLLNPFNILKDNIILTNLILKRKCRREKEILQNAKYIVGRTDYDKRLSLLFAPGASYFHLNEVLRSKFYEEKCSFNIINNRINIISISGNENYKGFETILKTCQILKNNDTEFKWEIIGINPKSDFIKLCIKEFHIKPEDVNIAFLGILNENEIINHLKNSHVYVNTSHIENSSNSICEAMMVGMPIIATNVGGTPSLINNNMDGILIQDGDQYHLAGAIIKSKKNYTSFIKLGLNASKRSHNRHNKDEITKELLNIYKKVISENF